MIKRIIGFAKRIIWLSGYTKNPLSAVTFLLRRRRDAAATVTASYAGKPFSFRGGDMSGVAEVLDEEEYAFLTPLLTNIATPVVYDIGGHIGLFAMWCLRQNAKARVFSLEANPTTYAVLTRNIDQRHAASWQALNRAAWKDDSFLMFNSLPESMSSHVNEAGTVKVQGINWDALTAQWPTPIDIMKIDIEGAEEAFVASAPHMLSQVANLVIELHPNRCNAAAVQKLLETHYGQVVAITGRQSTKPLLFCSQPRASAPALHAANV